MIAACPEDFCGRATVNEFMANCVICGEALPDGARVCTICGSNQPEVNVPVAAVVSAPVTTSKLARGAVPPGGRICPACGKIYGVDFADAFCTCGSELVDGAALADVEPTQPAIPVGPIRPPAGTPCLALIGADKQPAQYFSLTKDAVLIGRLDAVAGVFPEIDVTEWLDAAAARKVSRQHALILRSRTGGAFTIRPLAGNTGTQIEADMVPALHDYPLAPGTRIILGGAVRFRFEG
jgi:Double zinc ribbon/FHA domain